MHAVAVPVFWTTEGDSPQLMPVRPWSEEGMAVASYFLESMPICAQVESIERWEHGPLFDAYCKHKEHVLAELKVQPGAREDVEAWLFYSSFGNVENVLTDGFPASPANMHHSMYGLGAYFARDPRLPHWFMHENGAHQDGLFQIILSRVVVGRCFRTRPVRRPCDALRPEHCRPPEDHHSCTLACMPGTEIIVFPHAAGSESGTPAYPAYLIRYRAQACPNPYQEMVLLRVTLRHCKVSHAHPFKQYRTRSRPLLQSPGQSPGEGCMGHFNFGGSHKKAARQGKRSTAGSRTKSQPVKPAQQNNVHGILNREQNLHQCEQLYSEQRPRHVRSHRPQSAPHSIQSEYPVARSGWNEFRIGTINELESEHVRARRPQSAPSYSRPSNLASRSRRAAQQDELSSQQSRSYGSKQLEAESRCSSNTGNLRPGSACSLRPGSACSFPSSSASTMRPSRSSSRSGRAARGGVKKCDPFSRLYQCPAIDWRHFQGTAGIEITNVPDLTSMGVLPEEYFLDHFNSELTRLLDFDFNKGPPVEAAWSGPRGTLYLKLQSNMLVVSALRVLDNLRVQNGRLKARAVPLAVDAADARPQIEADQAVKQGQLLPQTRHEEIAGKGSAPEPDACEDGEGIRVLDTMSQREHFKESLVGKRVLHVKGFGSGLKDPTASQFALQEKQEEEAIDAIMQFSPDFIVVDGDPWGNGFQSYIKAFADAKCFSADPLPCLIWAKNVALAESKDGRPASDEERERCLKRAREWAEQGVSVTVFWIDPEMISAKIADLFGEENLKKLQPETFNTRGLIRIMCHDPAAWVSTVDPDILQAIQAVEDPARESLQFFEKCSFENAAKGNVIFDALDVPTSASHGVLSFGGGESVLLELATLYLNSGSRFDKCKAAVYPFSRGREDTDPVLPRHVGSAFLYDEDAVVEGCTELPGP